MKKHLKRAFIPHEDNNHVPELLQRSALFGMAFLIVLSFMVSNVQALLWQSSDWLVGAVLPAVVIDRTNKERTGEHLGVLAHNTVLDKAAQMKADDMAAKGYFAHYSPAGVAPWHWFDKAGYSFVNAGENLAVHFTDSDEVVTAWMNSPTHRANIVNPNYTEIGVGTARGTYEGFATVFVVQLFGTPAAPEKPVAIAPIVPTPITPATTTTATATKAAVKPTPLAVANDIAPVVPEKASVAGIETIRDTDTRAVVADDVTIATDTQPVALETPGAVTNIARTEIDEETNTTSLYSTMISTTTDKTPASATVSEASVDAGLVALATTPSRLLQIVYVTIGTLVAFTLLSSLFLAWRRHSPRHILFGVLLLLAMTLLFYVHLMLTAGAVVI